jgi:hypothetical protein
MTKVAVSGKKRDVRGLEVALLSAAVVGTTFGCKCGTDAAAGSAGSPGLPIPSSSSPTPAPVREAVFWDFVAPTEPTLLSLWPPDSAAPDPAASGVRTSNQAGAAAIAVDGTNPHVEWTFKPPLKAGLFALELYSAKDARIEISWRSKDCAAAVDACSAPQPLGKGRETLQVALPGEIAALRISFPEDADLGLTIQRMQLFAAPKATSGWRSGEPNANIALTPQGMQLVSPKVDPSVVMAVAGLGTSIVGRVQLDVGTGRFAPQLFWRGTSCANFSEECSVMLESGTLAGRFTANLAGHPRWTGWVHGLRLDPGEEAGAYVIKRLALLRR